MKLIIFLFVCSPLVAFSKEINHLDLFYANHYSLNQNSMLILGSWALGNIVYGSLAQSYHSGSQKYFHIGNASWNLVNLGIASFALYNNSNDLAQASLNDALSKQSDILNFLALNVGLDVAYIMTGLYLKEKAFRHKDYDKLSGFGKSLILQGSFLLVFDTVLYFMHSNNSDFINSHLSINLSFNSINLIWNL